MDRRCPIEKCECNFGGGCHKSEIGDDDTIGQSVCHMVIARIEEPTYQDEITRGCQHLISALNKYNRRASMMVSLDSGSGVANVRIVEEKDDDM